MDAEDAKMFLGCLNRCHSFAAAELEFPQTSLEMNVVNIFIRNLDPTTTEAQLKDLFAAYGLVETVTIVRDRDTNGPRGFAFVEMTDQSQAKTAIESLNGFRLNDRAMRLNEARQKPWHDPVRDSSRGHRQHKI